MDIYRYTEQAENILLEKVVIDTNQHNIEHLENGNILLSPIIYNTINTVHEVNNHCYTSSKIISCCINNEVINVLNYNPLIKYIYQKIGDGSTIIRNTKLNIKTLEINQNGFQYIENLGISFQRVDANNAINEIVNQCQKNNISINLKIILDSGLHINIII